MLYCRVFSILATAIASFLALQADACSPFYYEDKCDAYKAAGIVAKVKILRGTFPDDPNADASYLFRVRRYWDGATGQRNRLDLGRVEGTSPGGSCRVDLPNGEYLLQLRRYDVNGVTKYQIDGGNMINTAYSREVFNEFRDCYKSCPDQAPQSFEKCGRFKSSCSYGNACGTEPPIPTLFANCEKQEDGTKRWTIQAARVACPEECPIDPPDFGTSCEGYKENCNYGNACGTTPPQPTYLATCQGDIGQRTWVVAIADYICSNCPEKPPSTGDSCENTLTQAECPYGNACGTEPAMPTVIASCVEQIDGSKIWTEQYIAYYQCGEEGGPIVL